MDFGVETGSNGMVADLYAKWKINQQPLKHTTMAADEVLYTDGHDIVVTPSTLQVKGIHYRLIGITKHGMAILRPVRLPGIIMIVLGAVLAVLGMRGLIPSTLFGDILINGKLVAAGKVAIWAGAAIAALGILLIALVKEKYAVRIATAEGEKNAVVSNKREYIHQIINALNRAFMVTDVKHSHMNKTMYL